MLCTPHQISFGCPDQKEWDGLGMQHVQGRGEMRTGFQWKNLREEDPLKNPGVDFRIILKQILEK